jgi:uncharacterized hydrophobic protein (TIGR00271 family)
MSTTAKPMMNISERDQIRSSIRDGAKLSLAYVMMNILASTIACYGLFANSTAVVIGAMIVAMLLGPIAAAALALVEGEQRNFFASIGTLLVGLLCVVGTALVLGLIHKDIPITAEIMARTAPNFTDLMIALAGGAAGAYATMNPRLSVAFVGVAIATALVPPLCAGSILMVRGEYALGLGCYLLTFTNIVAIQFSSSVVLWLSGVRHRSDSNKTGVLGFIKGNFFSLAITAVLAVFLTSNLRAVVSKQNFETDVQRTLRNAIEEVPGNYLVETRFNESQDKMIVRAIVRGPSAPSSVQVASLSAKLPSAPHNRVIDFRVRFVQTTIITPKGELDREAELQVN